MSCDDVLEIGRKVIKVRVDSDISFKEALTFALNCIENHPYLQGLPKPTYIAGSPQLGAVMSFEIPQH